MKYVDLFAGCGGFSEGLYNAGFHRSLAVELNPMAAETYCHNHCRPLADGKPVPWLGKPIEVQALRHGLVVGPVADVLSTTVPESLAGSIDLLVGGPPCQGFSTAGQRNPDDVRNTLPGQFMAMVERIKPRAVVMENVVGMTHRRQSGPSPFEQARQALTAMGYQAQGCRLNAAHYGVPQHRHRMFIIALRDDVASAVGFTASDDWWQSRHDGCLQSRPMVCPPTTTLSSMLTVRDALRGYHHGLPNTQLRKHSPKVELRFMVYHYLRDAGISRKVLAAKSLAEVEQAVANAPLPARGGGVMLTEFRSELVKMIWGLRTKKYSQRALSWDEPAPTVCSLPDDMVHPDLPRTFTVREMARFQGFTDGFVFRGKVTTGGTRRKLDVPQYTQVGNAVPPPLAQAIGENLMQILKQTGGAK